MNDDEQTQDGEATAEEVALIEQDYGPYDGFDRVKVRMRVNLVHNSKATNIDTTGEVEVEAYSPARFDLARAEALLAATIRGAFAVAVDECHKRGAIPVAIQPADVAPLDPDAVPF